MGPQGPSDGPQGPSGEPGPGLVFRGAFDPARIYYDFSVRKDVVKVGSTYYYTNNPAKNGLATWGTPGSSGDWLTFTEFTAVATSLLLAEDCSITRTLTLGSSDGWDGIIQSANYAPLTQGFILKQNGYFECNEAVINAKLSVGSACFNVADELRTFPAVAATEGEAYPNLSGFPGGGTRVELIDFGGWLTGSEGFNELRYGKPDIVIAAQGIAGFAAIGSGHYASVELVYSTDGGSTWLQINGIEASTHDPNTFVNVSGGVHISGLSGSGTLKFAMNFKSNASSSTIMYCKMQVQVFNL
jgi:hypothetical protein